MKKRPYEHMRLTSLSEIHVGAEVFWHDPDNDACSRYAIVTSMPDPEEGEEGIITLDHGTEVFLEELS
jgi:hypothetical protein